MTITWNVTITPLNIVRKEAGIVAIRIDDTNPVDVKTETHTIISAILATVKQKQAVLDQIWQMHLDYQDKQTQIANYIGNLEAQAKTALEARET